MKFLLATCLLATLCVANAKSVSNATVTILHRVPYTKLEVVKDHNDVEKTSNVLTANLKSLQQLPRDILAQAKKELKILLNNQVQKAKVTVVNKTAISLQDLESTGSLIYNETVALVEESNFDGINADKCMTKADEEIMSAKGVGTREIETCEAAALLKLGAYRTKIVETLEEGEKLSSKLDDILVLCASSDLETANTCVIGKTVEVPVHGQRIKVETVKDDVLPVTNDVINSTWTCAFRYVVETREKLLKIKEQAKVCIRLSEEKKLMA